MITTLISGHSHSAGHECDDVIVKLRHAELGEVGRERDLRPVLRIALLDRVP